MLWVQHNNIRWSSHQNTEIRLQSQQHVLLCERTILKRYDPDLCCNRLTTMSCHILDHKPVNKSTVRRARRAGQGHACRRGESGGRMQDFIKTKTPCAQTRRIATLEKTGPWHRMLSLVLNQPSWRTHVPELGVRCPLAQIPRKLHRGSALRCRCGLVSWTLHHCTRVRAVGPKKTSAVGVRSSFVGEHRYFTACGAQVPSAPPPKKICPHLIHCPCLCTMYLVQLLSAVTLLLEWDCFPMQLPR